MNTPAKKDEKGNDVICRCNNISQQEIQEAIRRGCNTLPKIFDATTAGVGACGGSCRVYLERILKIYQDTGQFPKEGRPRKKKKR